MSSRALKRLERQRAITSSETHSSDDEPNFVSKPKMNAFALLNDEDDDGHESEPEKDSEIHEELEELPRATQPSKKSKKKKKGKKKPVKVSSDEENIDDDDLDRFLEDVRKRDQKEASGSSGSFEDKNCQDYEKPLDEEEPPFDYADANFLRLTTSRLKESMHLLSVGSVKNLDPDTELQNLFGKLSFETIEDANSTTSLAASPDVLAQFKSLARITRGWGGKDHKNVPGTTRKLLLTRIRDDWLPTTQKPLSMDELKAEEVVKTKVYKEEDNVEHATKIIELKIANEDRLGIKYFCFKKLNSIRDRVANSRFFASVVMTPDPESLMQLLQQSPYHMETLLQVSMVMLREGNNKATSNALIEKSLFVFDRSLNKHFHELLQAGNTELIRLPYESFANRQFYLTLFRVIVGLGERSTFYTALNFCKFLLALSPAEDPLGVRYFLDHYAILSENYEYLAEFVGSALSQTYTQWFTPGLAFSRVLAFLHLGKTQEAKKALADAFSVHPLCAYELLKNIGLSGHVATKPSDIQTNSFAELANETYLVRAHILWKEQTHRQFLHDELMSLFDRTSVHNSRSWLSKWFGGEKKEENATIPVNLIRFVVLSGENKVLAKVPEKVFERDDMLEYDVIPPKDENAYPEGENKATDLMFDYLDHNIISAIVQNRSAAEFEDFLGLDEPVEEAEQEQA
ncbi:DUF654-domain-containing protein [Metschnikowia bicuspidata var. bicuspidata NRRL YB-4993]|uniref:DUF654-domain-containing protein n=1 Tax=Metschnikowia bicuspidata var. bicuspidata NRRL YB-4993 TaxID=869754 RepID=A0A1A0H516_9ASCO|nr:DUF654-domain-containing protein [Metschnikowia bicuspidata var. bicuspidata NRRL YB-4993]OBA19002.1 DUF654-domain-containing protein [Metschnikowia bicuspidata var. bicuspidata NRRL YB-4993]